MNLKQLSLFLASLIQIVTLGDSKPYFDVQLDRIEQIQSDPEYIDISSVKVRRFNKSRIMVGQFDIRKPIGNEVLVEIISYKKQGNEFRLQPYKLTPKPLCDLLINDAKSDSKFKYFKIKFIPTLNRFSIRIFPQKFDYVRETNLSCSHVG